MFAESSGSRPPLHHSSRFRIKKRYPTDLQWQMFRKLQNNMMEPQIFIERWEVTQEELARICSCSVRTVKRWFSSTENRKSPTSYHKFCLGLTNKLWTDLLNREEH